MSEGEGGGKERERSRERGERKTHLNVSSVLDNLLLGLEGLVVGSVDGGESPLLGDNDLLSSRELRKKKNEGKEGRGQLLSSTNESSSMHSFSTERNARKEEGEKQEEEKVNMDEPCIELVGEPP